MDSYEADVNRLRKLYEEVPTDDEIDTDDDSVADPDYVEVLEHETDSEQDEHELEDIEPSADSSTTYYYEKNGTTKWRKEARPQTVRTRIFNIVSHLPGVIGNARNLNEAVDCWNQFFDDEIIKMIVWNTNIICKKFL